MMKKIYPLTLAVALSCLFPSCRYRVPHRSLIPGISESKEAYEQAKTAVGEAQEAEEPLPGTGQEEAEAAPSAEHRRGRQQPEGLEIPVVRQGTAGQILHRTGYTTAYNPQSKCPVWVAWKLTADHTYGPYKRKGVSYREDADVPLPRATTYDYQQSGYDRGHMCPSGDNRWSSQAQTDCFLFTNMCPQNHNLNGGDWNELEMKCRNWAEQYGEVYIVCGPIYNKVKPKTIGKTKIWVPDAFYKVVLRLTDTPAAIGFVYENQGGNRPMDDYVVTVDEVEELTDIDFFPLLDDALENRIEAESNLADW